MDPVTALGVASGAVALVEFTSKILSTTYQFSTSPAGLPDELLSLEDTATSLQELISEIDRRNAKGDIQLQKFRKKSQEIDGKSRVKIDDQLQEVCKKSQEISKSLQRALDRLKIDSNGSWHKWKSFRQALAALWSEKEIRRLEESLAKIRSELDTALLASLRWAFLFIPPLSLYSEKKS